MSVQLIVYPQSFEGGFNEISSSPTEFLVNGINFNNLDNTGTYTSSVSSSTGPYLDALTNAPPTIYNTWYRYRNNVGGTPVYPTVVAGNLVLNSVVSTISGIYQKLSNLTIGAQYTITINFAASSTGGIVTKYANGLIIYGLGTGYTTSTFTDTFTAQSTTDTVMVNYYAPVADNVTITDISIQPVIGAIPSGATNVLENGQVLCDLYEDEDIPLSLSVDDFKNVAEKVQSYSKAFNLPATKRNNRIFDNIFEITRSYDGVIFNPYKKTKCVLKQDGFILFEGYLRMLDVTDKEGETSYNVNLYSEVVALADVLGDRAFRDLDFTELEHDYNRIQVGYSWNDAPDVGITYTNPSTSGFRNANDTVKYPFVDWNKQITFNVASGNPILTNLEAAFRPFINIKYIIDRIFQATPFTYESEFFDSDDFKKLFMDFNWGSAAMPIEVGNTIVGAVFASACGASSATTTYTPLMLSSCWVGGFMNSNFPPNYDTGTNIITSTVNNETYTIDYNYRIKNNDTVTRTVECQWLYNSTPINYSGVITIAAGATFDYTGNFTQIITAVGGTLQAQFRTNVGTAATVIQDGSVFYGWNAVFTTGVTAITTNTILQTLRGELGQWDFLKGLMTMFNLVTLPDENNPNNIKIEPYSDVFINSADSVQLDWTEKIDVSEMKLTPLTDLNKKTIFKFVEDDDDYAFNVYKNSVGGHLYGSKKYNAGNEFNILFGEDEIVAEPFAATVVKPLMDNFPDFIIPTIYARGGDGVWEGFDNSPRIMYNNGVKNIGVSYYIPAQNGESDINIYTALQFSHLSDVPTIQSTPTVAGSKDFHFGECQLMTGVGSAVPDNLFNLYWLPYYSELYNPNTRTMTIKVNLSPADINTFKFNDTVYLKNRVFRVNKIDYKPNDLATVEFILIP